MFTGIVEGIGSVASRDEHEGGARLRVEAAFLETPGRGDSIAVDGVCLTATTSGPGWFDADLSLETLSRTTLGALRSGAAVNLERPLRLGDRLGGHLVQGHVDAVGSIRSCAPEGSGARVRVFIPPELEPYIVMKGSIAVDGVSLTVAARGAGWFEVALIPETLAQTTWRFKRPGDAVNLEVDMMGRYVVDAARERRAERPSAVTREFLARHGFGDREVGS
jgi:riboflavin synthase